MVLYRGSGLHKTSRNVIVAEVQYWSSSSKLQVQYPILLLLQRSRSHCQNVPQEKDRREHKGSSRAVSHAFSAEPRNTHQIDQEEVGVLFSFTSKGGVNVTMDIAGSDIDMEMDTGATLTLIPAEVYQSALSHVQLSPSSVRLQTCSGESSQVRGKADVPVRYGNQLAVLKIVVDGSNKPAILGRSWLQLIHMDCMELIVSVQGEKHLSLVERFPALFGPGVDTLEASQVRITLKGGAQPKFYRPRSVLYTLQEKVDSDLSRLQTEGILRPVESS